MALFAERGGVRPVQTLTSILAPVHRREQSMWSTKTPTGVAAIFHGFLAKFNYALMLWTIFPISSKYARVLALVS